MGLQDAYASVTAGSANDEPEPEPVLSELEAAEPEAAQGAAGSVLAKVRQRARQLQTETTIDLPIPGYENVVGRYRAISIARVYNGPGGQLRNPITEWGVAADALATALESLYGLDDRGELVPLYESGDPARYDDELAAALDLHPAARTARAVLVEVCGGGAVGESRVWGHFMAYQAWLMEGSAQEVAEQAVGESFPGS